MRVGDCNAQLEFKVHQLSSLLEFEKLEANGKTIQSPAIQVWKPSPENFYKINNDGAYNQNTRRGGVRGEGQ